jgi:hypothetical protein
MAGRKLPIAPKGYEQATLQVILNAVEQRLTDVERAAGKARYSITAPAARSRVYDPNTATLAQTADVLATLLLDLKEKGGIG